MTKLTSDQSFKKMLKKRKSQIEGIIDDVEKNAETGFSPNHEVWESAEGVLA